MARNTTEIAGNSVVCKVAAKTIIEPGELVMLSETGFALPGKKKTNQTAVGRAEEYVDNSQGQDGDKIVVVRRGIFKWDNDSANAVTDAHLMKPCYIKDHETVTSLATGASVAGKVVGIYEDGIAVETL